MAPSTDLAYDLLWFFAQSWKPELYIDEQERKDNLALRLPCALSFIVDEKNKDTDQVRSWQTEVRKHMIDLGFYSGKFESRDDKYFAEELKNKLISSKEPTGQKVYVFVYTNVGKPVDKCKSDPNLDETTKGRCAYANEAIAAERQTPGGIKIGIELSQGLSYLWTELEAKTRNKQIQKLQFFDHGAPDLQLVGGDRLTPASEIPQDMASRFAKGAEITFYGCKVLADSKEQLAKLSMLATHVGNRLLARGGKVFGFIKPVGLEVKEMKIESKKALKVIEIAPCNGPNVMGEIMQFMKNMKDKHKVKYAEATLKKRTEVETDTLPKFLNYPDDYPNRGFYT